MSKFKRLLTVCLSVAALTACTLATEPVPAGPIETGPLPGEEVALAAIPSEQPDLENGEMIFAERCAACHGPQGAGDGELAEQIREQGGRVGNLTDPDLVYSKSPQEWYSITTNGNIQALMPPWEEALSEQERWDVTYYLYTLSLTDDAVATGQAIYEGQFDAEFGPMGEDAPFSELELQAELSREEIIEEYFSDIDLDLEERQALAAYVQTFAVEAQQLQIAEVEPDEDIASVSEPAPDVEDMPSDEGASEVERAGRGSIEGVVENASGGALPADLEVRLNGITITEDGAIGEFLVRTEVVEPDGNYRFDDVPVDIADGAYVTSIFYEGVEYNNGTTLEPGQTAYELPIEIYESTTDPAVVEIERLNLVVRQEDNAIFVFQILQYSNLSDAVYVTEEPLVGGRRGSIAFNIPRDAFSVEFGEGFAGGRYIVEPDGTIFDTQPLFPGQGTKNILVTYFVPLDGDRDVPVTAEYQVNEMVLLLEEGPNYRVDQLTPGSLEVVDGVPYEQFTGTDISAGEVVLFSVQTPATLEESLPLIIATAILILVAAGVVYRLVWGVPQAAMPTIKASPESFSEQQQILARQIAELDDTYATGAINRFDYEAKRARLKAQLIESLT